MATHSRQMSDAFRTTVFLTLSGGFQDAYTYMGRGKVFANAQTGNIVLMATNFCEGDFAKALRYLLPLLAFAAGAMLYVVAAELLPTRGDSGPGALAFAAGFTVMMILDVALG